MKFHSKERRIMNIFDKIREKVKFEDELPAEMLDSFKYNNYACPFCGHESFRIYNNRMAKCHSDGCKWSGDVTQFYADKRNISKDVAVKELCLKYDIDYDRNYESLVNDATYILTAKNYDDFYGLASNTEIINEYKFHRGSFNKIWSLNHFDEEGQYVSKDFYYKAMVAIRNHLPWDEIEFFLPTPKVIHALKKKIKQESVHYFKDKFDELSLLKLIGKQQRKARRAREALYG